MSDWKTYLGLPQTQGTYRFLLVLVIDALGSGMYLPLSLLYFQVMGFALPITGLILTLATFCTLPLSLITGSLVDRFGARRLTASSQLIEAIGLLGYLLFVHTVPTLFLMAVLVTGGNRMFYAAQTTLVVDLALPHERDRWYGLVGAIRAMGSGMGGLLVGLVLSMNHPDLYRVLIGGSALCYLVAGRLLWRLSEPGARFAEPATPVKSGAVWKDRVFLGFVISNLAFPLCGLILTIALPVYLPQAVHAPPWVLGPALALNSLLVISCQTLVVRFLEPHRRTRVLGVAALIWCLSCSLFVLALIIPHFLLVPYLLLAVALHTLASLIYMPTASALVADFGPATLRGRYLATYEFCWGVANALTPVLFTVLYAVTPPLPWIVLAGMLAASGILMCWFERRLPTQAGRASTRNYPTCH